MLASRSQFVFQGAFPNYPPSDTFAEPLGLYNLTGSIWDLRCKYEGRFDPLLYLGDDVMHSILLYAVSLWDIVESRPWETEIIPRNSIGDPLVFVNVSRRWSQFITSSPQLWSYLLIDTDDEDVLEYLQLFLRLSRNAKLFIVLHGSAVLCDAIVVDLLQVGDRIGALVYPPNVPPSTLGRFQFYLSAPHDQFEHVCRWYKLEVRSPQHYMNHYSFPTSIQSLWMDKLLPLSRLMALSHFQSLSSLSVRISHDRFLSTAHNYRLELPKLEVLRVQATLASDHQVDTPINMTCGKLKFLDLRYRLELELETLREEPATWIEFDRVDGLEQLQIDLEIHVVTEVGSIEHLMEWLQMGQQQARLNLLLQERGLLHLQKVREMQEMQEQARRADMAPQMLSSRQQREDREDWRLQKPQVQRFAMSIYTHWRKWLNLPNSLTHVQQSSLRVTSSTWMPRKARRHQEVRKHQEVLKHQGACTVIRDMVEEILMQRLPQLVELTTFGVSRLFPKHLRKLRLHGFAIRYSTPSITLPSLVSLEVIADCPGHLLVMTYIQVPQLRVLRVRVEDRPGTLYKHDWGHTTNNVLDHISLRIEIPRDKQGNHTLDFHLPRTHSLHVFSPYIPLRLYLARPEPLLYTLNAGLGTLSYTLSAGLGTMSGQSHGEVRTSSAMWNERLVTEWINPCGLPNLAPLQTMISLQRIVLSQRSYVLSEQSPADTLFKLLEQNIDTCPQLDSVTLAQCPSSWPRFLWQLRKRNRDAILLRKTKCIEELEFCQPLHVTIVRWLVDAIKARIFDVIERPPIREGNAWPMRPFEAEGVFRSCYVCHITGMELGCFEYKTRDVDCGRERSEGSKIFAC